jgi:hypothetical protein
VQDWTSRFGENGGGGNFFRDERMWGRGNFVQTSVMRYSINLEFQNAKVVRVSAHITLEIYCREIQSVVTELEQRISSNGIVPHPLNLGSDPEDGIHVSKEKAVMLKVSHYCSSFVLSSHITSSICVRHLY